VCVFSVIDLHCHTNYSDGSAGPIEILDQAIGLGLDALAITDHDTLGGYDCAKDEAQARSFDLLCGVELSTHFPSSTRSVHLLGYFASDPGECFRAWLGGLQEGRRLRNVALLLRLRDLGMDISWDELEAIGKNQIGRPHFAKLMLDKGFVASLPEAFHRYLAEGGLAWVDRDEPALEEALARVVNAGGVASLAHPVRINRSPSDLHLLLAVLAQQGLEAMECFHPEHTPADTQLLLGLADKFDLVATGGSDFHGSYKPDVKLGSGRGDLNISTAVLDGLRGRFASNRSLPDSHAAPAYQLKVS
jgi:predicted metal-dependent phosphoesterase TrpH